MMTHIPSVFWFYGLSGAGKTTLSSLVRRALFEKGIPCLVLDGDHIRSGLSSDLRFSAEDRAENIRRAAEVAKLACNQGLIVLAAFITPEAGMRTRARALVEPLPFYEIYLDCDYTTCSQRDVKGLYAQAAAEKVKNFTGKDAAFELPNSSDLRVDTQNEALQQSFSSVLQFVGQKANALL